MFCRNGLTLVTAGVLAIAAMSLPASASAARDRQAATTEFSAQANVDPKKKAAPVAPRQAPARVAPRPAPVRVAPRPAPVRVAPRPVPQHVAPRQVTPHQVAPRVIPRQVGPAGAGPKNLGPNVVAPVAPRAVGAPTSARRVFTPRGTNSRVVTAARIRSAPARGAFRTTIRGRNYTVWRSGYRVRRGDGWRTFVALGTLGVLAIGAAEYYPYAYIDAPEPYCDGLTEDGCQMVYDEVETMEGDMVGQCVAYCPWQ
jgi:hypothetical protein